MAQPTQFSFALKEVAALLVKEQGLQTGRWAIGFDLGMTVGNFGQSAEEAKPGAMVQIAGISLVKADEAPPNSPLVVDAADLATPAAVKDPGPRKRPPKGG